MLVEKSPAGVSRGCFPRLLRAGRGEGDALPREGIRVQAHGAAFFPDLLEVVTRFFPKWKTGGICAPKCVELAVGRRKFVDETH